MSRACGDCTACCTVMAVREIGKRVYTKCSQICATGCAVYLTRPIECARFKCMWLDDADGDLTKDNERPDLSGVLLTFVGGRVDFEAFRKRYGYPPLQAFEVWPGAFDAWAGQKVLERVRRRAIMVLCPYDSLERRMLGPDRVERKVLDRLKEIAERNARQDAGWEGYGARVPDFG